MRYVRVPQERVAVIIGPNGKTRKSLEKKLGVRLEVDSEENEVRIHDENPTDPVAPLKAEEIVKAMGRGFSPDRAFKLMSDDMYLHVFDVHDYAGKDRNHVQRLSSRVIGKDGRTRRIIEDLSETSMSVFGHTVSLIGDVDGLEVAKSAVDMLLSGAEHASVYRFLESKRREFKRARLEF